MVWGHAICLNVESHANEQSVNPDARRRGKLAGPVDGALARWIRKGSSMMRYELVLFFLTFMGASVLAQQEGKFEVAMGIGTDIARTSTIFKNDHNLSTSICYKPTNEWGMALYFGQQVYSLDRLPSQHENFLGGRTPKVIRTVTSLLVGYRGFIPGESKIFSQYGSVALGFAKSVSSPEGYYYQHMSDDTLFNQIKSGYFPLGLLSLGIQVRPFSFFDLFLELQTSIPSNLDLSPGLIAGRIGVGVLF